MTCRTTPYSGVGFIPQSGIYDFGFTILQFYNFCIISFLAFPITTTVYNGHGHGRAQAEPFLMWPFLHVHVLGLYCTVYTYNVECTYTAGNVGKCNNIRRKGCLYIMNNKAGFLSTGSQFVIGLEKEDAFYRVNPKLALFKRKCSARDWE